MRLNNFRVSTVVTGLGSSCKVNFVKCRIAAIGIAAIFPLFVGLTPPAQAGTPPKCVNATVLNTGTDVLVTNNCRKPQHVKVLWKFAKDSGCKRIAPGSSFNDSAGFTAKFSGLESC